MHIPLLFWVTDNLYYRNWIFLFFNAWQDLMLWRRLSPVGKIALLVLDLRAQDCLHVVFLAIAFALQLLVNLWKRRSDEASWAWLTCSTSCLVGCLPDGERIGSDSFRGQTMPLWLPPSLWASPSCMPCRPCISILLVSNPNWFIWPINIFCSFKFGLNF